MNATRQTTTTFLQRLALCLLLSIPATTSAGPSSQSNNREIVRKLHGITKANAIVDMRIPVTGIVRSTQRRMGDRVQAGEVLLQIDNREAQENLLLRQAELQRSEAENSLAYKQWQRMRTSHEKGVIADLDVEKSYLEHLQRQAERKIAEARLHMAEIHLDNHRMVALTDGVIVSDGPPQGEFLSAGEPALNLLDDSTRSIMVRLSEPEIAHLLNNTLSLQQQKQSGLTFSISRVAPRTLQHSTLIEVEVTPPHSLSGKLIVGTLVPLQLRTTPLQEVTSARSLGSLENHDKGLRSGH